MEGFLPSFSAPGLITVPLRPGSFPRQHWPPAAESFDSEHSRLGVQLQGEKKDLLDNLMIRAKCVIPPITPTPTPLLLNRCGKDLTGILYLHY